MNRRGRLRSPQRRTRADSIAPCGPARSVCAQHLARVQYAFRIERALQRMHDGELNRVRAARELPGLEPPDAVLGADAAAETFDQVEHGEFERMGPPVELRQVRSRLLT